MNKTIIILVVLMLMGCASQQPPRQPVNFRGEGTQQEFITTRYECMQESQSEKMTFIDSTYSETGATILEGRGGTYTSTNCSLYNSCLASKGYYRADDGNFVLTPELQSDCD